MRFLLTLEELEKLENDGHVIKWIPQNDQTENNKKFFLYIWNRRER